jgi:predicted SAM-dependent methyltransferase
MLKIHLGCQEKYLEGYVNIDLPPSQHTAQEVKADQYADVRELTYEADTVDEIRTHHMLEHFSRQESLVLLSRWHKWLKLGGIVHIETPDFEESARKFLKSSRHDQQILGRHIFGSHEAEWAYHKDFWSEDKFRFVLGELGFGEFKFEKFSNNIEQKFPIAHAVGIGKIEKIFKPIEKLGFNLLPNIVCYAKKVKNTNTYEEIIESILRESLVGRETAILDVWMKEIRGKV